MPTCFTPAGENAQAFFKGLRCGQPTEVEAGYQGGNPGVHRTVRIGTDVPMRCLSEDSIRDFAGNVARNDVAPAKVPAGHKIGVAFPVYACDSGRKTGDALHDVRPFMCHDDDDGHFSKF